MELKTQLEKQMDELYNFKLLEQGLFIRFKNFSTNEEILIDVDLKTFTHNIFLKSDIINIEGFLLDKGYLKSSSIR